MGDRIKRSRRRTFIKTVGAASIAGLAGCSSGGGSDDGGDGDGGGDTEGTTTGSAGSGDPIIIGNAAPTSGSFSPWGRTHRRGLEFAVQEINDNGGVLDGRELRVVTQDTEANPQNASTVFERLVNNEDAAVVTGPVSSDVGITCRDVAEELEVPHLPNQASSTQLLTRDTRYTFRVGGTASPTFVLATLDAINANEWEIYDAIYADYAYGQSHNAGIERYIQGTEGLSVNVQSAPPQVDDVQTYLRQVQDGIDILDLGGHPIELFAFIQQANELGIEPDLISGPNIPSSVMVNSLGDLAFTNVGLFASVDPAADDYLEVASRFAESEETVFEQYHAFGYTTGQLVAAAVEEAGSADPTAIRDALSGIEYDSILAYPTLSYTEWGEIEQAKLYGLEFSGEGPSYYEDGAYSVQAFSETDVFDPIDPSEW